MIKVERLSKRFGTFNAVNDVSFCVEGGEIFGLLGPNGAGKSTTIRMLIGLTNPSQGQAFISGFDCFRQRQEIHRLIGVVFELPTLYERLSVRENLLLFARLHNVAPTRLAETMARLSLDAVQDKLTGKLSKGWKQRVVIARALLHHPRILILDEPTSGLDPNSAGMLRKTIRELRGDGTTIVLCTHDMQEADELCDRVGIMYRGQMRALDTPYALKGCERHPDLIIEYLDQGEIATITYALDDPVVAGFLQRHLLEHTIISITTRRPTLADVFAAITGGELS